MSRSPEVKARIQAVEMQLAALDPILQAFCARTNYTLSRHVGVWPRRMVWARDEIDRTMWLTMNLTVPEVMERGFYPELPWSLEAGAALRPASGQPTRILMSDIFRALPFSQLADILDLSLENGRNRLQGVTQEDIIARGEIFGGPPTPTE